MRRSVLFLVVFILYFGGTSAHAQSNPVCGLSNDSAAHIPASYTTFTAPAIGSSYVDALTGCTVWRITNSGAETVYYASLTPFSSDNKLIMITIPTDGGAKISTAPAYSPTFTPGTVVVTEANMPGSSNGKNKWDLTNPLKFYFASGNSIMSGTVTGAPSCIAGHTCTISSATVHQFTEYNSIVFADEPDISQDGNSIQFVGFNTSGSSTMAIATWNMNTSTKTVWHTTACTGTPANQPGCIHKTQTAPAGGVIITYSSNGSGAETGVHWYHGAGPTDTLIQNGSSHLDSGYNKSGVEVFLQERMDATMGTDPCPNGGGTDLSVLTTPTTGTCSFDKNWASVHIAYRGSSTQPWVTESFFDTRSPGPEFFNGSGSFVAPTITQSSTTTGTGWYPYEGEIVMYQIDNANGISGLYRLAHGRSRSIQNFWAQDTASPSRDAHYVAFSSNMAFLTGACSSPSVTGCSDVYVISGTSGAPLFSGGGGGSLVSRKK